MVRNMENIETKSIACPICKVTSKFVDYKPYTPEPKAEGDDPKTKIACTTDYNGRKNKTIGKLLLVASDTLYALQVGTNTIGRKATTSSSSVQIDTEDKTMSRQHAKIEVVELASGGYKHYFSNASNKNVTLINDHRVEDGDKLVLNGGEQIKMANVVLKFILAPKEPEETPKEDGEQGGQDPATKL